VVDPASLPPDGELTGPERSGDGGLRLSWESGAPTIIHPGWLYEIAVDGHLPAAVPGPPRRWTAAELSEPPDHDGNRVLGDDAVLEAWVTDLPTRETSPGFQFLHCVENSDPGGESRITDGPVRSSTTPAGTDRSRCAVSLRSGWHRTWIPPRCPRHMRR
jgi:hypothetical protein